MDGLVVPKPEPGPPWGGMRDPAGVLYKSGTVGFPRVLEARSGLGQLL